MAIDGRLAWREWETADEQKRQAVSIVADTRPVPRERRRPRARRARRARRTASLVGAGVGGRGRPVVLSARGALAGRIDWPARESAPAQGAHRCQSTPRAIGKTYEPGHLRGRPREDPRVRAGGRRDRTRCTSTSRPPGRRATRTCVAPPMFAVVYSAPAVGPPIFDPEIELNFAMMVHGGQEFVWGPPVIAGDEITTTARVKDISEARRPRLLRVRVGLASTSAARRSAAAPGPTSSEECERMAELTGRRAQIPELQGHARQVPDGPLRGRLGRLQPDPHRRGVRARGRPARPDPARPVDDGPGGARADRGGRAAPSA